MARKKREHITKTTRFEVFKRDSFTCQYCGRSAPEALLELDHIEPVASGGGSDVLNLVTACKECNAGKRDRRLSDQAVINRQVDQLKELQDRRQQLEMMVAWRKGLRDLETETARNAADHMEQYIPGWSLNDLAVNDYRTWIRKYGFIVVLEAIDACAAQYVRIVDGKATQESVTHACGMVPRVASVMKDERDNPHMAAVNRVVRILLGRGLIDERWRASRLVESAVLSGVPEYALIGAAKRARTFGGFDGELAEFVSSAREQAQ